MANVVISIAHDFSSTPAGRVPQDGPFNGQRFRQEYLDPAIAKAIGERGKVIVEFSDADSYSSSFLEEAFGGLARSNKFHGDQIRDVLVLKSDDPVYAAYVEDAKDYLNRELKRVAA